MKKWMIRGRFSRDAVEDARGWWDFEDGQYSYSQESSFCSKREEATIYNTLRGARGMLTCFKKQGPSHFYMAIMVRLKKFEASPQSIKLVFEDTYKSLNFQIE